MPLIEASVSPHPLPDSSRQQALLRRASRLRQLASRLELIAQSVAPELLPGIPGWESVVGGEWYGVGEVARRHSDTRAGAVTLAVVASFHGEVDLARGMVRAAGEDPADSTTTVGHYLAKAMILAQTASPSTALQELSTVYSQERRPELPGAAAVIAIFAELALQAGHPDAAMVALEQVRGRDFPPLARAEVALAEAMLSADDRLEEFVLSTSASSPFVFARASLHWGMRLRRLGHPRQSRAALDAARDVFREIGARSWAETASRELRATGIQHHAPEFRGLSAQEFAIARLVAQGLSNRDIAERLTLSPRTVSSHLYRIYPKVGVGSRHLLSEWLRGPVSSDEADLADEASARFRNEEGKENAHPR